MLVKEKDIISTLDQNFETGEQEELTPAAAELIHNLKSSRERKTSLLGNLTLLLITAALFLGSGLIDNPVIDIFLIILVILFHEAGHFAAMKIFGYRDVKMFFIPFFGAAVSGKHDDISSSRKALISLAGPVPGIIAGYMLLTAAVSTYNATLFKTAYFFIYLNGFNLIPLLPLDGGRFMAEMFFNRNRYVELVFKIIAAAAFIYLAVAGGTLFLAIIGGFLLLTVTTSFKLGELALEIKRKYNEVFGGSLINQNNSTLNIIASSLRNKFPEQKGAGYYENLAEDLWERIKYIPPKVLYVILLIASYSACWLLIFNVM